jgi:release factor glutamine methyltransferase
MATLGRYGGVDVGLTERSEPPALVERLRVAGCVYAAEEFELLAKVASTPAELAGLVRRRCRGEPLEHVAGRAVFCGLDIRVTRGVFVPRRRSEFLVECAVPIVPAAAVVVDMCCGSGAVGAAIRAQRPDCQLHAVDIDPTAVSCARTNLPDTARVHLGDLHHALPGHLRGNVDVLVANAPYVPTGRIPSLPAEARNYEPTIALDGGPDGMLTQRQIIAGASEWLCGGGRLVLETCAHHASTLVAVMTGHGFGCRTEHCADREATVVIGTLSRATAT